MYISTKREEQASYSNLNSKASISEVRSILSKHLDKRSVDNFINLVTDYNNTVGSVGLSGNFAPFTKTDYDVEKSVVCGQLSMATLSAPTAVSTPTRY